YGKDSSSGFSRHSAQSFGTFACSQTRNSSRKATSSGVRFRSISSPARSSPQTAYQSFGVARFAPVPEVLLDPRVLSSLPRFANSGRIVPWPRQYFLRRSRFSTLPVPVLGKLSRNSTERGHSYWARRERKCSLRSI